MSGITFASNTVASRSALYLNQYQEAVNKSVERLSSGKKFNSASDSPGETGYINRFRSAIMSYKTLNDSIQDNMSLLQTADSAISGSGGITTILESIREKSVYAQNSTLTSQDKQNLQQEIEDLIDELDDVVANTEFNTKKLLNGEMGAKLSSTDSGLAGYATDVVNSDSFFFQNITGATQHLYDADNAPTGTTDLTGSDYDYTKSLGTTGTVTLDGASASADGDFDVVFTSSSEFDIYNNSTGNVTASGSVGEEVSVNGVGITIGSDGTYADSFKLNFSLTNGSTAIGSLEAGNRQASAGTSLTNATWGSDSMMNSYFDIKFQFDSGALKYAAYDPDGNRMGSWVASGEEFTAYDSSKLDGSTFTFTAADAGVGDTWRAQFATYDGLQSAGGTIMVGNASDSFSVSYTGKDKLSDIVSSINESGEGVATAELDTSSGSSILNITAIDYGEEARLSMYDNSGDFVSTLGLTEKAGTGTDASVRYNGKTYESSTGYFSDIEDNVVFEVANDTDIDSGYVNVVDKSYSQPTNINGGSEGVSIFIRDLSAQGLGLIGADGNYKIDVTTSTGGEKGVTLIDSISDTVTGEAAKIGSIIDSMDYHTSFLDSMQYEYEDNLSLHEDTDFAEETTNYYVASAGRDSAAAMVAQANLQPSRVLQLLGILSS